MKILLFATVSTLCMLGISGCSNEMMENSYSDSEQKVLMTMQVVGPQTRANYTDNGNKMNFSWNNGDGISVMVHNVPNNGNCCLSTTENGKSAPFTGNVSTWEGSPKTIYAFYPYSAKGYTVSGADNSSTATVSLTLPEPQFYTVGGAISNSFMEGVGTATPSGSSIDASATLHQVMSIIKLNITKAPGKLIGVRLKCLEPVFPTTATVKLSDGTISNPGTFETELSMNVSDGTSETNKVVSFAMFPIDLKGKTISIDVIFDGELIKTVDKAGLSFARNTHYVMSVDATGAVPRYIEVDGLKWATGDLVADRINGARIGTPTDGGLYFQFGSLIGWNAIGAPTIATRPKEYKGNTSWSSNWTGDPATVDPEKGTGDPCKYYLKGTWRLPSNAEYSKLFGNTTGWSNTIGWFWISSSASAVHKSGLKLPAAGYRKVNDGSINGVGECGFYWSSSPNGTKNGYDLGFSSSIQNPSGSDYRADGFPVRCVSN